MSKITSLADLNRIKEEVSQEKLNEISFDITNLNFLNSSGLKALLNWIIALSKLKKEDKFNIIQIINLLSQKLKEDNIVDVKKILVNVAHGLQG